MQWQLGDMTDDDETLITDFQDAFPTTGLTHTGEIFAYQVDVTGYASGIHFDAFNHVDPYLGGASYSSSRNPYSHDAAVVPEPSSLLAIMTVGLGLIGGSRVRRRFRS
jgi:hypothetical protein